MIGPVLEETKAIMPVEGVLTCTWIFEYRWRKGVPKGFAIREIYRAVPETQAQVEEKGTALRKRRTLVGEEARFGR